MAEARIKYLEDMMKKKDDQVLLQNELIKSLRENIEDKKQRINQLTGENDHLLRVNKKLKTDSDRLAAQLRLVKHPQQNPAW
jgi:hypothetical protein